MDWTNETVLEFIELLEGEPCIWNPKSKHHKNRNLVNEAWTTITSKLSVPCSIEELKKKRNTLLTQYRECLRKINESTKTDSNADQIYRPSWFAFDAIHNYMGTIYGYRPTIFTETQESTGESALSCGTNSLQMEIERPLSRESNIKRSVSRESNSRSGSDCFPVPKRQRGVQEMLVQKILRNRRENEREAYECDLYGQLLAQKLKNLDKADRLVLMNQIDNTVFTYIMNVRKSNKS